ncbi:hypothetical protein [Rothia koreensis]|uniref:hypothetical protein n=1 Tax=Rothia koreensis TaxID=592378 RepID=UPI003FCDC1DD
MSYSLKIKRHNIEMLKEEAWRVMGGPKRIITDEELAGLLLISQSSLTRMKGGGKVPNTMIAAVMKKFAEHPEITDGLWHVEEPQMAVAS